MTTEDPYRYFPLQDRCIRLLRATSADNKDNRVFEFLSTSLEEAEHAFTAISYTWGDPDAGFASIVIDGKTLLLPLSAVEVIDELGRQSPEFTIWIDVLCINQKDLKEKAQQVRYMGDVYKKAALVLIWLGSSTEESATAFAGMAQIQKAIEEEAETEITLGPGAKIGATIKDERDLAAYTKLFERPWFRRIWVVQEVILAENALIICGEDMVLWQVLEITILEYMIYTGGLNDPTALEATPGLCAAFTMFSFRGSNGRKTNLPLEHALSDFHDWFLATDPRDIIFGVIGFVTDGEDPAFAPDYEADIQTVYIRAMRAMMRTSRDLRLLLQTGIGIRRTLTGLPSWVPDFTSMATGPARWRDDNDRASPQDSVSVEFPNDRTVAVHGRILSTIKTVVPGLELVSESIVRLVDLVQQNLPYPSGASWYDVAWRTSIMNNYAGTTETKAYSMVFQCYIKKQGVDVPGFVCTLEDSECIRNHRNPCDRELARNGFGRQRRICVTDDGYVGLVLEGTREGDKLCLLMGAKAPFIIRENPRKDGENRTYTLVGHCYIDGVMNGKGLEMGQEEFIRLT